MDRVTLNFSLPNFITIGLIMAAWFLVLVVVPSFFLNGKKSAPAEG